jgi:hypothetical protein
MQQLKAEEYNIRLGLQPGNVYKIIDYGHPQLTFTVKYLESFKPGVIKVEFLKIEGPGVGGFGRGANYPIVNQFGFMTTQTIQSAELVEKKGGKRTIRKGSHKAHRKSHRKSRRSNRK